MSNGSIMWIRLAASVAAAVLFSACSGAKAPTAGTGPTSPSPAAATAAPSALGNAPVAQAGAAGAIPLEPAQRRALDEAVAKAPPAVRGRLRYALAAGDDGKTRLVVYDGGGLGKDGRDPRRPHEYVVFRILNSTRGEHYDPQQNSIVAPIPPPVQREDAIKP
jgi:hypothetical protein